MEPGESLEEAAARELREEAGLTSLSLTFMEVFSGSALYYRYPNGDEVYNVVAAYRCTEYTGTPVLEGEGDEVAEVCFFGLHELPEEGQLNPADRPVIQHFVKLHKDER
jgi:8-oxo-dGTP pyrophosphatase MutT (NUDIX family)